MLPLIPVLFPVLKFLLAFIPVAMEVSQILKPAMEQVGKALEGILKDVQDFLIPHIIEMAKAIEIFASTGDIAPLLNWGVKFLTEVVDKASAAFIEWFNKDGVKIVAAISAAISNMWPAFVSLFTTIGEGLKPLWQPVLDKILLIWKWLDDNYIKPIGSWLVYFITQWLPTAVGTFIEYMMKQAVWAANMFVHDLVVALGNALVDALGRIIGGEINTKLTAFANGLNTATVQMEKINAPKSISEFGFGATSFPLEQVLGTKTAGTDKTQQEQLDTQKQSFNVLQSIETNLRLQNNPNQVIKPSTSRWAQRMQQMTEAGEGYWG